ncbi:MAG: AAA family ATPase [Candidatus Aminicenantes bacterium]|nr:AAA family ATPase [Candidatus Aminicenantes bacterium]
MYKSFNISDFRCFENFFIENLDRINLIVGKNNVGKTALLEAIFLHCGAYNPELAFRVNAFRGIESIKIELTGWSETPWDSLFHNFDSTRTIEISGENNISGIKRLRIKIPRKPAELKKISYFLSKHEARLKEEPNVYKSSPWQIETAKILEFTFEHKNRISTSFMILDQKGIRISPFPTPPPFPAFFQASRIKIPFKEEAERFGKLEMDGKQSLLLETLKIIEPRLTRLFILVSGGEPILHGELGTGRPVPLPLMGEGMVKMANIILHIANATNGVVLIDEIDNGLHHSILKKAWEAIADAARTFNTQIFASTHSMDCIIAAHEAFSDSELYDFKLHRLQREGTIIKTITYDRKTLNAAITSELEVR